MKNKLLEAEELHMDYYPARTLLGPRPAPVKAVNGVSLDIAKGETLGLVGESGSGKSTFGRIALGLLKPTSGRVIFDGEEVSSAGGAKWRELRTRMQIVFQDPNSSLNPRMKVRNIIGDGLKIHGLARGKGIDSRVGDILLQVGLRPEDAGRYPHEFSGGQRQRIGIARALILDPEFIVLDEPVSALDVSIQAQVINLLKKLKKERDLTYLFIAHDIGVVANICDRVAVMYLGKIMEITDDVLTGSRHPYTKALIDAIPNPDPAKRHKRENAARGEQPSPSNPPSGCVFRTRCPLAEKICAEEVPEMIDGAACHVVNR